MFIILCGNILWYEDGVDNTIEESSSIFCLIWMC